MHGSREVHGLPHGGDAPFGPWREALGRTPPMYDLWKSHVPVVLGKRANKVTREDRRRPNNIWLALAGRRSPGREGERLRETGTTRRAPDSMPDCARRKGW